MPALVTTGPNATNPGVLGEPGTVVLYGDDYLNDKSVSGGRIQAGHGSTRVRPLASRASTSPWPTRRATITAGLTATRSSPGRSLIQQQQEAVAESCLPRGTTYSRDGAIDIGAITSFHGAGRTSSSPLAARKLLDATTAAAAALYHLPRPLPCGLCRRLSLPRSGGSTRHHRNPDGHGILTSPKGPCISWSTISSTRRTRSTAVILA